MTTVSGAEIDTKKFSTEEIERIKELAEEHKKRVIIPPPPRLLQRFSDWLDRVAMIRYNEDLSQ